MVPNDYSNIPGISQDNMQGDMSVPSKTPQTPASIPAGSMVPTDSEVMNSAFPSGVGYTEKPEKFKPENILNDPNATEDQKMAALSAVKSQEQEKAQQTADQEMSELGKAQEAYSAYQQKMVDVEAFNQEATKRGLKPLPSPDPKKFGLDQDMISKLSHPAVQELANVAQEKTQQEDKQVQQAKQDATQQVHEQKRLENQQIGQDKAILDSRAQLEKAMHDLESEQKELSDIDPERFWKTRTTGQKIWAMIAIGLGGGPTSSGNAGYDGIQQLIDRDISAQKVNQEKALALRSNGIRRAQLAIEKFSAITKDEERKQQAKVMQSQLEQTRRQTMQELVMRKRVANAITSGDGISAEEAYVIDPEGKMRANLVPLPNGKFKAASSPDAAKKFGEWNAGMISAQRLAQDLEKQVNELTLADKLTPSMFSAKKKTVDETVQALIGQLRLPLTGPGILTDREFDRIADKVIGDPTSLTSNKSVSLAQIKHLQNLLNHMKAAQYQAAGVQLDMTDKDTKNQLKLANFVKSQLKAGVNPDQVEKAARKLGLME